MSATRRRSRTMRRTLGRPRRRPAARPPAHTGLHSRAGAVAACGACWPPPAGSLRWPPVRRAGSAEAPTMRSAAVPTQEAAAPPPPRSRPGPPPVSCGEATGRRSSSTAAIWVDRPGGSWETNDVTRKSPAPVVSARARRRHPVTWSAVDGGHVRLVVAFAGGRGEVVEPLDLLRAQLDPVGSRVLLDAGRPLGARDRGNVV